VKSENSFVTGQKKSWFLIGHKKNLTSLVVIMFNFFLLLVKLVLKLEKESLFYP
jgi:hypothetical protein